MRVAIGTGGLQVFGFAGFGKEERQVSTKSRGNAEGPLGVAVGRIGVLDWQEISIGTLTGRNSVTVTDAMIDACLQAMDFSHPLFSGADNSFGRRVVPPDLVPKLSMDALVQDYCSTQIGANIRAKQYFKFLKPIFVDTFVEGTGKILDKYEKRGRNFVTFEAEFRDPSGELAIIDRRTQLILGQDFSLEQNK